jgi:hypothetical protein
MALATGEPAQLISSDLIERKIYVIRGQKVMMDADLAALYQVPTKSLNLGVRRNKIRFPDDFMFQLTPEEAEALRFQVETSSSGGHGGRRYLPYAFTQEGVAMLSSILRSDRAIQVNIAIMRTFVKLREILASHQDLAGKIESLERKYSQHDQQIQVIFDAIKELLQPPQPPPPRRRIGFAGSANH